MKTSLSSEERGHLPQGLGTGWGPWGWASGGSLGGRADLGVNAICSQTCCEPGSPLSGPPLQSRDDERTPSQSGSEE